MLDQNAVRRRFDRAAAHFAESGFVHGATRDGLLDRLAPLTISADTIVDLGAAAGGATRPLLKRFRGAHLLSIDLSHAMLRQARSARPWFARVSCVQAEATRLPLADGSVDLVFCNQLLPWIASPDSLFAEVARVLRPEGVFAFATLGPDSLLEIRRAWAEVDEAPHVLPFPDMHDIGDGLVRAGLRDPVLDVDRLNVSYRSTDRLFADLTGAGARNALSGRSRGLTGRGRFRRMQDALADELGGVSLALELIYGHCFGGGLRRHDGACRIDAGGIPLRQR